MGHRSEPAQQREARGGCDLHSRHFQHAPGKMWLCPTCFHMYAKATYGRQRSARRQRPHELWPGETMVEYPGIADGPRRVEEEEPPGAAAPDHERGAEAGEAPMDQCDSYTDVAPAGPATPLFQAGQNFSMLDPYSTTVLLYSTTVQYYLQYIVYCYLPPQNTPKTPKNLISPHVSIKPYMTLYSSTGIG